MKSTAYTALLLLALISVVSACTVVAPPLLTDNNHAVGRSQ